MKNPFLFLFLIFIISCSNIKNNEIALFNETSFIIFEDEVICSIDFETKNKYTENFNNSNIQVPLFKYIKNNNYEIFIGIPYNTSIDLLYQKKNGINDSLLNSKLDSLCYFKNYKRSEKYITEYVSKVDASSLIQISTMTISKEISDSLFNIFELSKRLKTKNN